MCVCIAVYTVYSNGSQISIGVSRFIVMSLSVIKKIDTFKLIFIIRYNVKNKILYASNRIVLVFFTKRILQCEQ